MATRAVFAFVGLVVLARLKLDLVVSMPPKKGAKGDAKSHMPGAKKNGSCKGDKGTGAHVLDEGKAQNAMSHLMETGKHHAEMKYEQAVLAGDGEEEEHLHEAFLHQLEAGTDTLRGMHLPHGLHQMPILTEAEAKERGITPTEAQLMQGLLGLPGKLELTRLQTEKYFGEDGRQRFFDRSRWLTRQVDITASQSAQLEEVDALVFNNERDERGHMAGLDFPFAPVRPEHRHMHFTDLAVNDGAATAAEGAAMMDMDGHDVTAVHLVTSGGAAAVLGRGGGVLHRVPMYHVRQDFSTNLPHL